MTLAPRLLGHTLASAGGSAVPDAFLLLPKLMQSVDTEAWRQVSRTPGDIPASN